LRAPVMQTTCATVECSRRRRRCVQRLGSETPLLEKGQRLLIALCRQALIEGDSFVAAVRLKRRQISGTKTPQNNSGGDSRKRIGCH